MSMSLCNVGQTYQKFMHCVIRDLLFVFVYIDNFLIFLRNEPKHHQHFRMMSERFRKFGLVVNSSKCKFDQSKLRFLGHVVSSQGIKPVELKVFKLHN